MPNDVKLQEGHPVDENLRPLKVGGKATAIETAQHGNGARVVGDLEATGDIKGDFVGGIVACERLDAQGIACTGDGVSALILNGTTPNILATALKIVDLGDFTIDAEGDIILDAQGGNITLLDGGSTYTPTAVSDATTKRYVDSHTVVTATAYSARVDATTWHLANNQTFQSLTGTDTTVGDTQDLGILSNFDMRCLMYIVPFNMTVHTVSGSVMDDDMDATTEKRMGIWRLPALAVAGADPGATIPDTLTLTYITDGFGAAFPGASKVAAFYDTSADFELTAGDGIFMAYLNPQSAGNDDVALTMSIWAHQTVA